jgi:sirohydrochlorin cobaltochelatase
VAWDEMWGSFCDLAMAGGPPHRGTLLLSGGADSTGVVVNEIVRGIGMVTGLDVEVSSNPGWVRVSCPMPGRAGWLARAIAMENVSVVAEADSIELPVGPEYRIEKEVKNVITVIAKTTHYFVDHIGAGQRRDIALLFAETELVQAVVAGHGVEELAYGVARKSLVEELKRAGFRIGGVEYFGWQGVECPNLPVAFWLMRGLVVEGVMARREGVVLYLPVSLAADAVERCVAALRQVYELARWRGMVGGRT